MPQYWVFYIDSKRPKNPDGLGKKKRMVAKLHALKAELIRRKHDPSAQVGEWLKKVVQGYDQYHAVPGNMNQLSTFRHRVVRLWRRETPVMRLPVATQAAAERMENELETSTDASLIGVTGQLLVEEIGLLRRPERDTPEMVNSADFGRRLLERARSLEPDDPRWRQ
jgi:hypothetical protein